MISPDEFSVLLMCVEWFLYGIYSGIFVIYLHYALTRRNESKTTTIVFYALCLLYILSTATVVCDILDFMIEIRATQSTLAQIQDNLLPMLIRISIAEVTVNGCCDFIAQCTLIYRCWIVWGKNTRVVILPSFLAIAYIVTWLTEGFVLKDDDGHAFIPPWANMLSLTGLAASMVVNALATGLIVFKILTVFLEIKATSAEQTLGSLSSTGGPKLQHILFIIIESGMALFAVQLVRVVITSLSVVDSGVQALSLKNALDVVIAIHEMLNGIAPTIILVRVSMRLSIDNEESFKEAVGSLNFNHPQIESDSDSLEGMGSSSSMPPQEDKYFDNPPSDSNSIILEVRRVPVGSTGSGSTGSTSPQERSKDSILATTKMMS